MPGLYSYAEDAVKTEQVVKNDELAHGADKLRPISNGKTAAVHKDPDGYVFAFHGFG